ncbi:DUF3000 domain-containing protein [Gulosibacter sp. 10]|uniref:DUF3000 domain-containing protein n=1 Tax=Gulosibacter sp. 10 TaxID=1255570 RepID=UPI00097F20EF|nr:DUF3000 domain-containing protein [Gulosibacter sp. 10]SJM65826.1 Uncharacterized protein Q1 colocalized with Q [Gulosibacter sp. 10]
MVSLHPVPAEFDRASESIRAVEFRSDLRVQEIRPPEGLAPNALALAADVSPSQLHEDSHLGTGRFIFLHDLSEPDAWRGQYRVVCFAQAPLETDIGGDAMLPEVAWSWLLDALADEGAEFDYPSGTVTVVNSKGFGELAEQGEGSQIEIRASWSPQNELLAPHVSAWSTFLCMLSGLPPVDSNEVPTLRHGLRSDGRG